MRPSRILLGVSLLCMITSTSLIADDQEETVREQVQQERTAALDRLSRLRDRMDKIQLQLEQLDIEKVVEQRLQQGDKQSVADELKEITASAFRSGLEKSNRLRLRPVDESKEITANIVSSELDQSKSLRLSPTKEQPIKVELLDQLILQAEVHPPVRDGLPSFPRATVEMSNLTSRAFDLKRRFFETRTKLGNKQKLFAEHIIAKPDLQLTQDDYKVAAEAIEYFESQISTAILACENLLASLSQERVLIEQQLAIAQAAYESARGTKGPIAASKRELLQLERQVINAQDSLDQLRKLAEIVKDRDEEDAASKPPATSETSPAEK